MRSAEKARDDEAGKRASRIAVALKSCCAKSIEAVCYPATTIGQAGQQPVHPITANDPAA